MGISNLNVATGPEMIKAKMFGEKVVDEVDGVRIVAYFFKGKLFVDRIEKNSPTKEPKS